MNRHCTTDSLHFFRSEFIEIPVTELPFYSFSISVSIINICLFKYLEYFEICKHANNDNNTRVEICIINIYSKWDGIFFFFLSKRSGFKWFSDIILVAYISYNASRFSIFRTRTSKCIAFTHAQFVNMFVTRLYVFPVLRLYVNQFKNFVCFNLVYYYNLHSRWN